ncbi:MAG: hypothetical protein ACRDS9_13730 [Pseudonocardiaceae bacterium]
MSARTTPAACRVVRDMAPEVPTDPRWTALPDQIRTALFGTTLPGYGGSVCDELAADEQGVAR